MFPQTCALRHSAPQGLEDVGLEQIPRSESQAPAAVFGRFCKGIVYTNIYIYMVLYIYIYICMYKYIYICIHIYTYIYTYICIYIYICTHKGSWLMTLWIIGKVQPPFS